MQPYRPTLDPAAGSGANEHDVPAVVVRQAVDWYVRLSSGQHTVQDSTAFAEWHAAASAHAVAWQRLQFVGHSVQAGSAALAPELARDVLGRAAGAHGSSVAPAPRRRGALKAMLLLGSAGTLIYATQRDTAWLSPLAALGADLRSATGERRSAMLPDGTRLLLNTATAVNLHFEGRQRRIVLLNGELLVHTGHDAAGRPLVVGTHDGDLRPLGTRFVVRRDGGASATRLTVIEGAVEVRPAGAGATWTRVGAGQQIGFDRHGSTAAAALEEAATGWTDGVLTAERMRLADFVAELSRHHPGHLRCHPTVADLRLSGAWPLDGPAASDRVLASLERSLPVRVRRVTRYWTSVEPAN